MTGSGGRTGAIGVALAARGIDAGGGGGVEGSVGAGRIGDGAAG